MNILLTTLTGKMIYNAYSIKTNDNKCKITLDIKEEMEPPVNLYYSLTDFYLNHRDFVKSRSFPQLRNAKVNTVYNIGPKKLYKVQRRFDG